LPKPLYYSKCTIVARKARKTQIKSRKRKKSNKKVVIGERKRVSEIPRYQNLCRWTDHLTQREHCVKFNEKIQIGPTTMEKHIIVQVGMKNH
jgi:hypothetical protein